jgi:hypothetical protein
MEAVTGQDVGLLLDALTGQITESQLFQDLGERIDLIDGPQTLAGSVAARIKTEQTARETADGANATDISQVQARLDTGDYAAVKTESSTNASKVTGLEAKYTVKIDVNGYVSGFGLASTANNATPFSEFAIRADRFYIASPSGPGIAPMVPFIVQTTATNIGGENVPVGVYINGAFIQGGSIKGSAIVGGTIEGTKLINVSADKITAGSIAVGQYIQSSSYVAGSQGWRINGDGTAEFGAASIRGQLTAAQIDTRGLSIKDANGNIIFAAGTPLSTANISGLGSLATQNGVSTAQVSGLGTLATQNNVSTSQVSGLGALATQNGVSTAQVSGLGLFATAPQLTSENISTYMAGAAIDLARINTASIGSLSALSATIGLLRTANTGQRTEIADNVIRVYDSSNVLRVKLGNLS